MLGVFLIAVAGTVGVVGGGCGGAGPALPSWRISGDGPARTVVADWDDVDAALDVAISDAEVAILGRQLLEGPDGPRLEYRLRSIAEGAGTLVVRPLEPLPAAPADGSAPPSLRLSLEARFDGRSDAGRAERLVQSLAARLAVLAGVEWKEVPESPFYR